MSEFLTLTCRWAGPQTGGRRACCSPKLLASARGVTADTCAKCYCRDHAGEPPAVPNPPKPEPARVALPVLPCVWGRELTGHEREAAGKDHLRAWKWCDHPQDGRGGMNGRTGLPLGAKIVCTCAGCGPLCPGYESEDDEAGAPAVLVTGGVGDFLAVEATLTPEERDRLEAVYYAAPAAAEIRSLWQALPNYPRLARHVVLPTGTRTLYSREQVEAAVGPLPAGVRDLSINVLFPRGPVYRGSSALLYPLARPEVPGRPYVVVVPHSTWFAPAGRAFDEADWGRCFETLDRHDLSGVVLCRERLPIPAHPRLVDRQGQTSIAESVELLKGAAGYLGIDSWASVLAAKLFPAARLSVKCVPGCHGWNNRATYFAPRTQFDWLTPRLEVPPWN